MLKQLFMFTTAMSAMALLGVGCATDDSSDQTGDLADTSTDAAALATGVDVCIRTDAEAAGVVRLFAANATEARKNYDQWFTDKPLATGNAGDEMCGHTSFAVQPGDQLALNGDWSDAKRWLVENRTPDASGSDSIHEIWISDKYYSVGKECAYQTNGNKGFDVVCTIR